MNPPTLTPTTSGGFFGGRNEEEDRVRMVLERMMMMMMMFFKSSSKSRGGGSSSSSSQLYFVDDEDEDEENKAGKKKCVWKHLDEEEERESTDVVFRCAKEIAEKSFAALDVYRLHFLCFTQNHRRVCDETEEEEEEEEKRERRRASNKRKKRRKRRRRAELVLAKLLFNNGDYLCALVVLSLRVDEEDDIVSSTSAVEVEEDDGIEEETKTLEGKCAEEISKKRLEKKKREKSFANAHKQEHEQENFEQDSVDVTTTTPTPSRTQQNANFFYDDIPAVLLRNGAYETSKAIGLARLASTSTSTDRTNNIINDEQIAAANAYNVALACLGANNDLESALELLSRSDVLRTYRFDQNYWLRVSSCMLQWHDKTKSKKTSDENRRLLKLVSSCIRSAKFVKELRQRGWNIFLILRSRGRDNNKEEEENDENDDDESVSSSSALLDEICDRFKVAAFECKSGSTIT